MSFTRVFCTPKQMNLWKPTTYNNWWWDGIPFFRPMETNLQDLFADQQIGNLEDDPMVCTPSWSHSTSVGTLSSHGRLEMVKRHATVVAMGCSRVDGRLKNPIIKLLQDFGGLGRIQNGCRLWYFIIQYVYIYLWYIYICPSSKIMEVLNYISILINFWDESHLPGPCFWAVF